MGVPSGFPFIFVLWVFAYFLPSLFGWQKRDREPIVALNLLLGWTVIGWVVALYWASSNEPRVVRLPAAPPANPIPPLACAHVRDAASHKRSAC